MWWAADSVSFAKSVRSANGEDDGHRVAILIISQKFCELLRREFFAPGIHQDQSGFRTCLARGAAFREQVRFIAKGETFRLCITRSAFSDILR